MKKTKSLVHVGLEGAASFSTDIQCFLYNVHFSMYYKSVINIVHICRHCNFSLKTRLSWICYHIGLMWLYYKKCFKRGIVEMWIRNTVTNWSIHSTYIVHKHLLHSWNLEIKFVKSVFEKFIYEIWLWGFMHLCHWLCRCYVLFQNLLNVRCYVICCI